MAFVSLAQAAKLTGKNASTITRAVQKGKVSCQLDSNRQRVFDPSELERAFGKLRLVENESDADTRASALESTALHDEITRLHEREMALVHAQVQHMQTQLEDIQKDRDSWRKQATYLLDDKREKETTLNTHLTTEQELRDKLAHEKGQKEHIGYLLSEALGRLERVRNSWLGRLVFKV